MEARSGTQQSVSEMPEEKKPIQSYELTFTQGGHLVSKFLQI